MRTICLFCFLLAGPFLQAQKTDTTARVAPVEVTITDLKGNPKKGEEVLFRSEKTGKVISLISGTGGKIKTTVPPGDTYTVSLKCISDTTKYYQLTIPGLADDEYFSEPFWVNIKFELARSYRLDNVHVDVDKATLRLEPYKQLTQLLEFLQRQPDTKVEIAGHTDNTGGDTHNLKLSQDRANTIRSYLLNKGIKATQVTAKGYGSSLPVADNNTEDGRQLNRRTEVRIL